MFFFFPSLMLAGRNIMIIFSQKILPISLISNYLQWLNSGRNSNRRVKLQKCIQTKTLMKASLNTLPFPVPFLGCCTVFSLVINKCTCRVLLFLTSEKFLFWKKSTVLEVILFYRVLFLATERQHPEASTGICSSLRTVSGQQLCF